MSYATYHEIQEIRRVLKEATNEYWLHTELFQFNWWVSLVLTVLPWFMWWKLVDKARIFEILTYGLLVGIVSITLDTIGVNLVWWGYPDKLLPMMPPLFPFDITLVPIINMLLYQYFSTWKSFIKAKIAVAAVYSFIFEPIVTKLGLYQLHTWKYWYSFPVYIIMAISLRWLMQQIIHRTINSPQQNP